MTFMTHWLEERLGPREDGIFLRQGAWVFEDKRCEVNEKLILDRIMAVANEAYPHGAVLAYYEDDEGEHGDTLAQFIARELREVCDGYDSPEAMLGAAASAIAGAIRELEEVESALLDEMRRSYPEEYAKRKEVR